MLQERIKRIAQYFRGIEMTGGLFIVKVQYKDKWAAYPTQDKETIRVAKSDEEPNVWFYYAQADSIDMEMIFDLIDETIEMNESVRLKIELLKSKVEELKQLFDSEPLSKLERLEFTFAEEKKTKSKRKYNKKAKETNEEIKSSINAKYNELEEVKAE